MMIHHFVPLQVPTRDLDITVPADTQTHHGAKPSAGTAMILFF